ARRAGTVRTRDPRRGDAPAAGLLPARGGGVGPRPACLRPGGSLAPAVGPARVHALARAPRRARARAAPQRARGGARPLTELPDFGLGWPGTELRQLLVEAVLAGDKTATAGLHGVFEEDPTPAVGERFALIDAEGAQCAVVEVTEVRVIPASDVDL